METIRLLDYASNWRLKVLGDRCCDSIDVVVANVDEIHCISSTLSIPASGEDLPAVWESIIEALSPFSRSARNVVVPMLVGIAGVGEAAATYRRFCEGEERHRQLVRRVVCDSLDVATCMHDHTKDSYYMFVTCGKFAVGASSQCFVSELNAELSRHFSLEPHHPEHEQLTARPCSSADIDEMAVDRLTRNLTASGGRGVDWPSMKRYAPRFHIGDVDAKLARYTWRAEELAPAVSEAYLRQQETYDKLELQNQAANVDQLLCDRVVLKIDSRRVKITVTV